MTIQPRLARRWLRLLSVLVAISLSLSGHGSHAQNGHAAGAQNGRDRAENARGSRGPATTLLATPSNPLVAFRFVFRAGSRSDPPGKEGLAALTAAMVAEGGTQSRTYEQVLATLYPLAAALDAACHKEVTVFSGLVHRDSVDAYLNLAAEMLTQPRFAPEDFERLRNEALDYVTKYLRGNNDEELGKWALQTMLYQDHPYGHPDRGTERGLKAITLDDVKSFHRQHYTLESLNRGIAGGFKPATVWRVNEGLGALASAGVAAPALPTPPPPEGLEVTIVDKPADATAISIGFPIDVTRRDPD